MKLCVVIFGVLAACAVSYAVEHGPLLNGLQPRPQLQLQQAVVDPAYNRQKRSLLLGAGLLGAGAIGAGVIGAGALGAGIIGAKAGFIGGALASGAFHGRSYGGYGGYYGGEHYYTSPSYYGGHRHYYTSPTYYEDSHYYTPTYYSGYRSYYPEEYVVEEGSDWC